MMELNISTVEVVDLLEEVSKCTIYLGRAFMNYEEDKFVSVARNLSQAIRDLNEGMKTLEYAKIDTTQVYIQCCAIAHLMSIGDIDSMEVMERVCSQVGCYTEEIEVDPYLYF